MQSFIFINTFYVPIVMNRVRGFVVLYTISRSLHKYSDINVELDFKSRW